MNILSGASFTLLRFLGRHYHDGYYVRELARLLGIGVGSASETLARLAEAGLVHREERGRLVVYRAAMDSPLLREVKICATLIELNPLILCLRGDVTRVILFGSTATGDDTTRVISISSSRQVMQGLQQRASPWSRPGSTARYRRSSSRPESFGP